MAGCGSCATGGCGSTVPTGCGNNGHCKSGGCNKLNSFDWLSNMSMPTQEQFNIIEVKFKGGRKDFFRNSQFLELYTGDPVIIDVQGGHHLGYVSMQGELVRLQMRKKKVQDDDRVRNIYRKASAHDLEKFEEVVKRELPTMFRARQIIRDMKLNMKLSDVEYQADNTKATFYYSADERVDFRELIKVLASEFKIRVEMRQISLRQEAGRIGGLGACGRELCCSTWLTDFKSVSTSAARYQNLSLNPAKLSGQCGRLKCCLNYELDTYLDALIDIPKVDRPLKTTKGDAKLEKVDIFKKTLWFSLKEEPNWYPITAELATDLVNKSKKGEQIDALVFSENKIDLGSKNKSIDTLISSTSKIDQKDNDKPKGRNKPKSKRNSRGSEDKRRSSRKPQDNKPQSNNPKSGNRQNTKSDGTKTASKPKNKSPRNSSNNKPKNRQAPPKDQQQKNNPEGKRPQKPTNEGNKGNPPKRKNYRRRPPRNKKDGGDQPPKES